jgi:hypothetical protein
MPIRQIRITKTEGILPLYRNPMFDSDIGFLSIFY